DGQRRVFVSPAGQALVDELMARHGHHRVEHACIAYALLAQPLHHGRALALGERPRLAPGETGRGATGARGATSGRGSAAAEMRVLLLAGEMPGASPADGYADERTRASGSAGSVTRRRIADGPTAGLRRSVRGA